MPKHPVQVRHSSLAAQVEANGLLPEEQRALRKGARGCMDCLAVDKRVMAYLGAGHDPCTRMGESHSWSPSFNVEDSNEMTHCLQARSVSSGCLIAPSLLSCHSSSLTS